LHPGAYAVWQPHESAVTAVAVNLTAVREAVVASLFYPADRAVAATPGRLRELKFAWVEAGAGLCFGHA